MYLNSILSVMNEVNVKIIILSSSAAIYASTPEQITEGRDGTDKFLCYC